jgi:molecular chaperone HtpG
MENGERVQGLALFESTADPEKPTTLAEYVERMTDDQEVIWYVTGRSREAAEKSPHIEAVRERGHEVLLLVDAIDEWLAPHLVQFDGKDIRSVTTGELDADSADADADAEADEKERTEAHASLLEAMQGFLEDDLKEVRLSKRLRNSAVCLVGDAGGLSPQVERMLREAGQDVPKSKRILELNPDHTVISSLRTIYDGDRADPRIESWSHLLFGQALLAEGEPLPDPVEFSRRVAELMTP